VRGSLRWMPVIAVLWTALMSGCATVREEQKPLAETTMMVTRAGDATTMTWTAQPAVDYVIWYADRRDAQARWNVLPGAERLRGQGPMTWRDQVPSGRLRYYRLQAVPQAAQSP
jgi:hypothetical protein